MGKGRFRIDIRESWCKGCGICAAFCPAGVLILPEGGKARAEAAGDCTGCGLCERLCPDLAIEVVRKNDAPDPRPAVVDAGLPGNAV